MSRIPVAACLAIAAVAAAPVPAVAQSPCDAVVAPGGPSLRETLKAAPQGQTICLRGTVRENVWVERPGVTLTSQPGQRATLAGQLVIDPDAPGVTVSDLVLDSHGLGKPSPIILGDDAALLGNDITNRDSPSICLILGANGHDSGAQAERTRIEANRIHDCGGTSNNQRHAVYVEHASETRIVGNEIFDNADRAVQLYPNAQDSLVAGNIIDGNGQGVIFSGDGESSSSGNVVRNNVITNPRIRAGIESWYPDGAAEGRANVATDNCVFGRREMVDTSAGGFAARANVEADPQYADRAAKDFRLQPGSPCAALLEAGRAGATARPAAAPQPAAESAAAEKPAEKPVHIEVRRDRGGRVALRIRLNKGEKAAYARVEVKRDGRWRLLGIPRLRPGKTTVQHVRASGAMTVRAVLLRPGRPTVATLRR
jgi:nitrous oxidase accessory protein NosD